MKFRVFIPLSTKVPFDVPMNEDYKREDFWNHFDRWFAYIAELAYTNYIGEGENKEWRIEQEYNFVFSEGSRYVAIYTEMRGRRQSIFGFVCKETGNVLKAASYKAPARNFARGHITILPKTMYWTGVL